MSITPKNCDISVKKAIQQLSQKTGIQGHPTFAGLTLLDLTASSLIGTNVSKALESVTIGTGLDYTRPTLSLSHLGIEALTDPGADRIFFWDNSASASKWLAVGNSIAITTTTIDTIQDIRTTASPEFVGLTLSGLTDDSLIYPSSGVLTSLGVATNGQLPIGSTGVTPVLATISGTTDHISIANGAGSITINLDTNTQTLLGSFNGIFLEKLDFTISEAGGTVTGSLEQDGGGDLIQKFSDGYTTLDCTPAKTIDLTTYVGTNAVPKLVFVYILQSNKTTLVASNSDWPATEHNKIARLLLKSAVTTGTDGGALVNQNWNDYAFDATGEGHVLDIEHRLRQEPAQYEDGLALTLKNSAGAALTTGNSSTAVELVTTEGRVFQLHLHTFPAFDMYSVGTDFAQIANQVVDEGGAYVTTADLVTDITRYVDGSDAGAAIGVNKYFNLVIWGVMNREGEASHIMINLPTGQYTTSANAVADIDGTSIFDIPFAFKGTGFLIARLTFRLIAGAEWTYIAIEDLRGQTPVVSAGVGISTTDHALLANLAFASAGHTGFQAQGDVLDDLNILGAVGANSEFLVGTGAGVLAWENAATAATSMGLGTGDSPTFANLSLGTGELTCGSINRASGTLTFEIGGTAELSLTSTHLTLESTHLAIKSSYGVTFYDQDNSHYVHLSAPNVVTTSVSYSWPPADGINGQTLITNGSGVLSWGIGGVAGSDKWIIYNASGAPGADVGLYWDYSGSPKELHITGSVLVYATSGTPNELKFRDASGTEYVGLKAPTTVSASTVWALPTADGANTNVLQTNGSGVLSWAAAGGGGDTYTDRGDPSGFDFGIGTFTVQDTYTDFDLSSIVPANATTVLLFVQVSASNVNRGVYFRKNGLSNGFNVATLLSQVINVSFYGNVIVSLDANRIIEYYKTANVTILNVTVRGWWI